MQTIVSQVDYKKHYTYTDYCAIDDEKRYEVIVGALMMVPAPATRHQRISGRIFRLMANFIFDKGLGEIFDAPTDVVLSDDVVVQPDILFISRERAGIVGELAIKGAPDLIVEVLSPSSSFNDTVKKRELYQRFGVTEYWLVFPDEKAIEILTLEGGIYRELCSAKNEGTVRSKLLQGFEVDLKAVF